MVNVKKIQVFALFFMSSTILITDQMSVMSFPQMSKTVSSNPDTRLSTANASDFVFDINNVAPAVGSGGQIQGIITPEQFPGLALAEASLSFAKIILKPCGLFLPHQHPRGTELLYVQEGNNVSVAFVKASNGDVVTNTISTGMFTVFPQGLVHYQLNLSCNNTAVFLYIFDSSFPGVIFTETSFYSLNNDVTNTTLGGNNTVSNVNMNNLAAPPAALLAQSVCESTCQS